MLSANDFRVRAYTLMMNTNRISNVHGYSLISAWGCAARAMGQWARATHGVNSVLIIVAGKNLVEMTNVSGKICVWARN